MRLFKSTLTAAALAVLSTGFASAATVDTVEAPTGFFVPSDAQKYSAGYWRNGSQDWDWTHNAIAGASSATAISLLISAFDVDFDSGEIDNIYAKDDGNWVLLGALAGANDVWAFTTFNLTSNLFDDVEDGLQVKIDINAGSGGWLVTLAKSVITVDGGAAPPPTPTVPVPAAGWLLLAGLGGLAALRRKR